MNPSRSAPGMSSTPSAQSHIRGYRSGVPLEVRMHGRKGSERLLRRREEMLARGMPQAKANAATAAELVRWLWALGAMCREATE